MRRLLAVVSVALAACGGGGSTPDSGLLPDSGPTTDGGPVVDAAAAVDAAKPVDAGAECNASSGALARAVGGSPGKSVIFAINISGNATDTDGFLGTVTENGADLELSDIAVLSSSVGYAPGGGAIHQIAYPALGTFTATRLGDAPGITALALNSTNLFGAGGLTLSRITPSPFAVTPIGTITPPAGCTKIVDFVAPLSGGDYIFQMLLDCGRVMQVAWTPGTSSLRAAGQDLTGIPTTATGLNLGALVTSDGKLYRWSSFGSGTLTLVRNLSSCLGSAPRGLQE